MCSVRPFSKEMSQRGPVRFIRARPGRSRNRREEYLLSCEFLRTQTTQDRSRRRRLGFRRCCDGELRAPTAVPRSEEHTSELQSHVNLVCRLLLEKKKKKK